MSHDGAIGLRTTKACKRLLKRRNRVNPSGHHGNKDLFPAFLVLFAAIYLGLTIATGLWAMNLRSISGAVYFIAFEMLFIGLAYDLASGVLSMIFEPEDLPKLSALSEHPPVALLMTICDDTVPQALATLGRQSYSNYDVFILDDSLDAAHRALVDQSGHRVLRRGTRQGFKAGNLNHWLRQYGPSYKYFVILDSDSLILNDFLVRMVAYAEHPRNLRTAAFQSKIHSWNETTMLQHTLGALAPLSMYFLERMANGTGTMFSFGHNVLLRTDCIILHGSFPECVTAEDTALSLVLSAQGYDTKLVDVVSFDTEPQDVFRYSRRTSRWARQTVELFRLPWGSAALRLKLSLCYRLYTYLIHNVYLGLLLYTAWASRGGMTRRPLEQITLFHGFSGRFAPWVAVLLVILGLWSIQIILRLCLARRAGVATSDILWHALVSTSLMYFTSFPISVAMLRTALGTKPSFTPTNSRGLSSPTMLSITRHMLPFMAYGALVLTGVALRNQSLLFGLNGIWLLLMPTAPLVLWLFHRRVPEPVGDSGNGM